MKDIRAIILAAGKGTRMKSDKPKVLHNVCGKAIIQYILDLVRGVGALKSYVVLGHKSDIVKEYIGASKDITTVEQKKLLGTADAVKTVERYFKGYRGKPITYRDK